MQSIWAMPYLPAPHINRKCVRRFLKIQTGLLRDLDNIPDMESANCDADYQNCGTHQGRWISSSPRSRRSRNRSPSACSHDRKGQLGPPMPAYGARQVTVRCARYPIPRRPGTVGCYNARTSNQVIRSYRFDLSYDAEHKRGKELLIQRLFTARACDGSLLASRGLPLQ